MDRATRLDMKAQIMDAIQKGIDFDAYPWVDCDLWWAEGMEERMAEGAMLVLDGADLHERKRHSEKESSR